MMTQCQWQSHMLFQHGRCKNQQGESNKNPPEESNPLLKNRIKGSFISSFRSSSWISPSHSIRLSKGKSAGIGGWPPKKRPLSYQSHHSGVDPRQQVTQKKQTRCDFCSIRGHLASLSLLGRFVYMRCSNSFLPNRNREHLSPQNSALWQHQQQTATWATPCHSNELHVIWIKDSMPWHFTSISRGSIVS